MIQTKLDDVLIKTIRDEVKKGKFKIEVAIERGLDYSTVKKYTHDIHTRLGIPVELEQRIKDEVNKGKSKRQVAEELHICRDTVIKYTRNIPRNTNMRRIRSDEEIAQIRQTVLECKSKTETAKRLGLTYWAIRWHTQDIPMNQGVPEDLKEKIRERVQQGISESQIAREMKLSRAYVIRFTKDIQFGSQIIQKRKSHLSKETIEKIRNEVRSSKTKMQVSRKLNISPRLVYEHTHDILIRDPHNPGLSGNPLAFLQEIIQNGYAKSSMRNTYDNYKKIKSKFPNIRRVSMYGDVIYFMQEYPDIAMRVFLENVNKKIYDYNTLKQITDVFQGNISKKEKKKYIEIRKNKYS